ncbi:hypothetical protein ACTUVN_004607 [Pseudomonas caspiana]
MKKYNLSILHPYMWLTLLSILCFVSCIWLPAFYQGKRIVESDFLLLFGWLGPLDGHFAWFANPIYLVALVYWTERRFILSVILAWIAVALTASFLFAKTALINISTGTDADDVITGLGWGYYLWLTAVTLLALALSHFVYVLKRRSVVL